METFPLWNLSGVAGVGRPLSATGAWVPGTAESLLSQDVPEPAGVGRHPGETGFWEQIVSPVLPAAWSCGGAWNC